MLGAVLDQDASLAVDPSIRSYAFLRDLVNNFVRITVFAHHDKSPENSNALLPSCMRIFRERLHVIQSADFKC